MAYADTIRATTATMTDVATLLENLLLVSSNKTAVSTINTTSASLTDYTGASISITTVTGQSLITVSNIMASHSTDAILTQFVHTVDGTDASVSQYFTSSAGSTTGALATICGVNLWSVSAGAHTFKIRWATSASTAYSAGYHIFAAALRVS